MDPRPAKSQNAGLESAREIPSPRTDTVVITPSVMKTSEPSSQLPTRPLTVTEWSRESERWVVSARQGDSWTLVGVFEHAGPAFAAADRAAENLAPLADHEADPQR